MASVDNYERITLKTQTLSNPPNEEAPASVDNALDVAPFEGLNLRVACFFVFAGEGLVGDVDLFPTASINNAACGIIHNKKTTPSSVFFGYMFLSTREKRTKEISILERASPALYKYKKEMKI